MTFLNTRELKAGGWKSQIDSLNLLAWRGRWCGGCRRVGSNRFRSERQAGRGLSEAREIAEIGGLHVLHRWRWWRSIEFHRGLGGEVEEMLSGEGAGEIVAAVIGLRLLVKAPGFLDITRELGDVTELGEGVGREELAGGAADEGLEGSFRIAGLALGHQLRAERSLGGRPGGVGGIGLAKGFQGFDRGVLLAFRPLLFSRQDGGAASR